MGANDIDDDKLLPAFTSLKPFEQLAVTLKADGHTNEEIMNTVNAEYGLAYKYLSVKEWFYTSGRLYPALMEYNDMLAEQAIHYAKQKIKRLSEQAAKTLEETMSNSFDGAIRERTARTVLNKFIPDRQIISDQMPTDDIPDDIRKRADTIAKTKAPDGPTPVDEPGKDSADGSGAGTGSDTPVS